jgi:hypothetical protein
VRKCLRIHRSTGGRRSVAVTAAGRRRYGTPALIDGTGPAALDVCLPWALALAETRLGFDCLAQSVDHNATARQRRNGGSVDISMKRSRRQSWASKTARETIPVKW